MATDNIREAELQSIEDGLQRLQAEADQLEATIAEKLAARKAHKEELANKLQARLASLGGPLQVLTFSLRSVDSYAEELEVSLLWRSNHDLCRDVDYTLSIRNGNTRERLCADTIPQANTPEEFSIQRAYIEDVLLINKLVASNAARASVLELVEGVSYLQRDDGLYEDRQKLEANRRAVRDLEKQKEIWELNLRVGAFVLFEEPITGRRGRIYKDSKIIYITKLTEKTMWYKILCETEPPELSHWEFNKRIKMEQLKPVPAGTKLPEVK